MKRRSARAANIKGIKKDLAIAEKAVAMAKLKLKRIEKLKGLSDRMAKP